MIGSEVGKNLRQMIQDHPPAHHSHAHVRVNSDVAGDPAKAALAAKELDAMLRGETEGFKPRINFGGPEPPTGSKPGFFDFLNKSFGKKREDNPRS